MTVLPTRQLLGTATGGYARLARQVQTGQLVRVRRGMVAENATLTPSETLHRAIEATAPFLQRGTWFSHRSAALIHGLPAVIRSGELVEVTRTFGGHGNTSRHLRARAGILVPGEGTWVDGLPATTLARTVLDLARTLPFTEAVMIADAALRLGADRDELLAGVGEGRGCRKAERVLLFADPASESPAESESRARIAAAGLPVPEIQAVIRTSTGRFVARVDFLWRAKKVIGEYDGEGKYTGEYGEAPLEVVQQEKERQAALEAEGYLVLRWGKKVLRQPGELERRIRGALASRPFALPYGEMLA
ncbi:MAG: hypothetical protein QM582_01515 [Micropruina sp.]|uniref:hypothetical protein n=1 Tax=Micropruina sp. TaxID=2737536 RepID=UPI0039E5A605